jgi:hypothetical protein
MKKPARSEKVSPPKHHEIKWNAVKGEWLCILCLRTSARETQDQAEEEFSTQPSEFIACPYKQLSVSLN